MFSEQDAREDRAAADDILKWLRNVLPEILQASNTTDPSCPS
jgi:hypothetical protein